MLATAMRVPGLIRGRAPALIQLFLGVASARRLLGLTTEQPTMKREDPIEKFLEIKREKGWSWKPRGGALTGASAATAPPVAELPNDSS